jgi:hypothetical protein
VLAKCHFQMEGRVTGLRKCFAGSSVLVRRSFLTAEVRLLTKAVGEGGSPAMTNWKADMTAYLISLSLLGLVAIALWDGFS